MDAFYENVVGQDGKSTVVQFRPDPLETMLVVCLWSHWTAPGEKDLLSFAIITDEPPPEILAAGHDRCPISIKPDYVDAWLNPDPTNLDMLDEILEDKAQPHYGHRLAATGN